MHSTHSTTADDSRAAAQPAAARLAVRECIRRLLTSRLDALYRFILYRIDGDPVAADDLLQQTARVALQHENVPEDAERVEAWLRGIAGKLVSRHWQTVRKGPGAAGRDATLSRDLLHRLENRNGHLPDMIEQELVGQLAGAVSELSAEDQWLLYAFYRHDRTRAQIGEELCVSPKSVETRLYRARCRLRQMLADNEGIES